MVLTQVFTWYSLEGLLLRCCLSNSYRKHWQATGLERLFITSPLAGFKKQGNCFNSCYNMKIRALPTLVNLEINTCHTIHTTKSVLLELFILIQLLRPLEGIYWPSFSSLYQNEWYNDKILSKLRYFAIRYSDRTYFMHAWVA